MIQKLTYDPLLRVGALEQVNLLSLINQVAID